MYKLSEINGAPGEAHLYGTKKNVTLISALLKLTMSVDAMVQRGK